MRKGVDSGAIVRNRLSRWNFVAAAGAGAVAPGRLRAQEGLRPEEGHGEIHTGLAARGRQYLVLRRQAVLDQGRHRRRHRERHRLGRGDPGDRPGQVRVRHPGRAQLDPAGGQGPAAAVARLLQLRHHHGRRGTAGIADQGAGRPQGQEGRLDPDLRRIPSCRPSSRMSASPWPTSSRSRSTSKVREVRADRQPVRRSPALSRARLPKIAAAGINPRVFLYSKYGLPFYAHSLTTTTEYFAKEKRCARR